ncbi:MAG: hypothetical protein JNM07_01880 [Phycisphaerae bacterium]|nr:hypothetical protein [Phycisphaerae bacterium]
MGPACLILAFFAAFGPPAVSDPVRSHARPVLIAEHERLVPGKTTYLGVTFEIDERWHIYWDGLNDGGVPPKFEWTLPPGFEIGPLEWPAPTRIVLPGDLVDHVYEGRVTILVPLRVPTSVPDGQIVEINAEAKWLVCKDVCLPGSGTLRLACPVGLDAGKATSPTVFASARARIPKPIPINSSVVIVRRTAGSLEIESAGATGLSFYPYAWSAQMTDPARSGVSESDILRLAFDAETAGSQPRIGGIIEIRRTGHEPEFFTFESR